jgi:hypothetical protein
MPPDEAKPNPDKAKRTLAESHPLTGNIAFIGSFALITAAVLKLLAVSHFDLTTALAITTYSNPAAILTGILVSSIGNVMLLAAFLLLVLADRIEEQQPAEHAVAVVLAAISMLMVLFTNPIPTGLIYVFLSTLILGWWPGRILYRLRREHDWHAEGSALAAQVESGVERTRVLLESTQAEVDNAPKDLAKADTARLTQAVSEAASSLRDQLELFERFQKFRGRFEKYFERLERARQRALFWFPIGWAGLLVLFVLTNLATDAPWLPAEIVTTSGGQRVVGYELGRDGNQTAILRDSDRKVVLVDGVTTTTICAKRSPSVDFLFSPLELLYRTAPQPPYPRCG